MDHSDDIERILILCDERGAEMTQVLEDMLNSKPKKFLVTMDIWCKIEANISKLLKVAEKNFEKRKEKYNYIYLFGGVYNLILLKDKLAVW